MSAFYPYSEGNMFSELHNIVEDTVFKKIDEICAAI